MMYMYIKDRETPLILTSEFNKFERNRWGLNGTESRRQRYVDRANFCARVFTQYWNQNPVVFFFFFWQDILYKEGGVLWKMKRNRRSSGIPFIRICHRPPPSAGVDDYSAQGAVYSVYIIWYAHDTGAMATFD